MVYAVMSLVFCQHRPDLWSSCTDCHGQQLQFGSSADHEGQSPQTVVSLFRRIISAASAVLWSPPPHCSSPVINRTWHVIRTRKLTYIMSISIFEVFIVSLKLDSLIRDRHIHHLTRASRSIVTISLAFSRQMT